MDYRTVMRYIMITIGITIVLYVFATRETTKDVVGEAAWISCMSVHPGGYTDCVQQYKDAYRYDMLLLPPDKTVEQFNKSFRCSKIAPNYMWDEDKKECVPLGE